MNGTDATPSPCTGICRLDDAALLCVGCGRTLEEIASWSSADERRRAAIARDAALRLLA